MEPAHMDDLPPEILENLQEMFPGCKVVCAGDAPGPLPPNIQAMLDDIEASHKKSIVDGLCIDCGAQMPGYDKVADDDWQPAEGWAWLSGKDGPMAWICPDCDKIDNDEAEE